MKRIICLTLTILFLLSLSAYASNSYSDFATGMGFMEKADDAQVTRGQFAEVLCKALGINLGTDADVATDWYNGLFTEDNTDTVVDNSGFSQKFLDVPSTHTYYEAITKISDLGLMIGTAENMFDPDSVILEQEAVKVLVTITGNSYFANTKGGYPYGYNLVAATNGMFEGCTYKGDSPLTEETLAVFLFNTLNMDLTVNNFEYGKVVFSVAEGQNILKRSHNISFDEGRVTANEFTALYSMPEAGEDKVIINGVKYGIKDASYVRDFIGYDIEFYYNAEDNEIKYAYIDSSCEIERFNSFEIEKFKDYRLYYYIDEEKSDTDYIDLSRNLNVIYNGTYMKEYTDDVFKFPFGDVTVIKSQLESQYDTVVINDYEPYYLTDVKSDKTGIYASKVTESNAQFFDLSRVKINCYDGENKPVSLESLKAGTLVEIAKGDDCAIIKAASKKLEGVTIKAIEFDEKITFITPDGETYTAYDIWYNASKFKPVAGGSYSLYVNSFGYVCKIDRTTGELTADYHLYLNAEYGSRGGLNDKNIKLKAVNNKGAVVVYDINENVRVYKGNSIIKGKNAKELYDKLTASGVLVENTAFLVTLSEEGKVTKLEFPSSDDVRKNMLGVMSSGDSVAYLTSPENMFENRTVISQAKVVFRINNKATDENKKYATVTSSEFADGNTYKMIAYNRNSDSVLAECVIVYADEASVSISQYTNKIYIVEKVLSQVNEEGESISTLNGYAVSRDSNSLEQVVLPSSADNEFATVKDFFGNTYTLKKGDVVLVRTFNGMADDVYLVYRSQDLNNNGSLGDLVGTSNVFDAPNVNTNPYGVTNQLAAQSNNMNKYRSGSTRFFAGYVTDIENSRYISYTNYLANAEKDLKDSKYLTETTVLPNNIVVIESKPFTVRTGTYADIKTYKNYGDECSRILINTDSGRVRQLLIFN